MNDLVILPDTRGRKTLPEDLVDPKSNFTRLNFVD